MSYYEYMVVPAPRAAPRAKGVKGTEARFAHHLAQSVNTHARGGWEYQRAETMPCEVKKTLWGRGSTEQQTVLVFRRWVELEAPAVDYLRDTAATPETLAAELPQLGYGAGAAPQGEAPMHIGTRPQTEGRPKSELRPQTEGRSQVEGRSVTDLRPAPGVASGPAPGTVQATPQSGRLLAPSRRAPADVRPFPGSDRS